MKSVVTVNSFHFEYRLQQMKVDLIKNRLQNCLSFSSQDYLLDGMKACKHFFAGNDIKPLWDEDGMIQKRNALRSRNLLWHSKTIHYKLDGSLSKYGKACLVPCTI